MLYSIFRPISCLAPPQPLVRLTGGDDTLQPDDVGVVKLSQDAGLAEEGAPLFVRAAGAKRLYGHWQLPLAGQLEAAATHLAEITWSGGAEGRQGEADKSGSQILVTVLQPEATRGQNRLTPMGANFFFFLFNE